MYTFEELVNDVIMGREIEFKYKDEWYSISHSRAGCIFTKFNDINNEIIFREREEIRNISINDRLLKDIINNNEIDDIIIH